MRKEHKEILLEDVRQVELAGTVVSRMVHDNYLNRVVNRTTWKLKDGTYAHAVTDVTDLNRTLKRLEEALAEKSRFLATMSHGMSHIEYHDIMELYGRYLTSSSFFIQAYRSPRAKFYVI